jgi:membrane dipeptidase
MMVIDAHLDLAWNALNWNRDLTRPISEIRKAESGMKEVHRGASTVCFEEMSRGEVAICLATVLARSSGLNEPLLDYGSREIASAMALGQLAYYRILEAQGYLRKLKGPQDLDSHLRQWNETKGSSLPLGYILSMEGADPILSPGHVPKWWEDGLRVVGLAHYGVSAYAHGTGTCGGLTMSGVELLRAMDDAGVILDVTHLADESFWQAVGCFKGSALASHANCRSLVPGDRQLSDDQIRYLIERESVIGVALDSWMLYPGYVPGETPNTAVSLERVVDHIDHVCQLAGSARHAAIGSDLDGGFGKEQSPHDLGTIADLQKIPGLLRMRGYKEIDIEAIMHANWLRFFRRAWRTDPRR